MAQSLNDLPRAMSGPAAEPIELSESRRSSLLKWTIPAVGALIIFVLFTRRLRK